MKTNDPMEYARRKLRISYCWDTDTLEIHNGDKIHSRYSIADGLTANLDSDGEAAGFTLERATELLLLPLSEYDATSTKVRLNYQPIVFSQDSAIENTRKTLGRPSRNILNVGYFQEYDTLDIWDEKGASFGWDVGVNLIAFSRDEDGKELNGFTLECAAQLLLPCFVEALPKFAVPTPGG